MSRGSVVRRGTRWAVRIELSADPATGKRRQRRYAGYRTKREAERALGKLLRDIDEGTYVAPSRQSVAQYLHEWLKAITPTVRESTHHSYKRNMELHVIPYVGEAKLTALDGGSLNRLYADLLDHGRRDGANRGKGLSARSVRYVHVILHRALGDAVRWGRLARNPADAADPPRVSVYPARKVDAWDAETLQQFLRRSRDYGDRYYPAWLVLATTGCRRGEVLGLTWSAVNLDDATMAITQTVTNVAHQVRLGAPKTTASRRPIALDAGTVEALRAWRKRQLEERLMLGAGYRDHDLVFAKVTGEPLHPERFSREFDRRVERWKLPRITLHGLRHSWATLALASGVHPRVVQERLGHSTIAVTLGIYSHTTPVLHAEAAELVASRFSP